MVSNGPHPWASGCSTTTNQHYQSDILDRGFNNPFRRVLGWKLFPSTAQDKVKTARFQAV